MLYPQILKRGLTTLGWKKIIFGEKQIHLDQKVWWIENNKWFKDNIWGVPSSYGDVYLSKKEQKKYEL